jgi:hypothetical protein
LGEQRGHTGEGWLVLDRERHVRRRSGLPEPDLEIEWRAALGQRVVLPARHSWRSMRQWRGQVGPSGSQAASAGPRASAGLAVATRNGTLAHLVSPARASAGIVGGDATIKPPSRAVQRGRVPQALLPGNRRRGDRGEHQSCGFEHDAACGRNVSAAPTAEHGRLAGRLTVLLAGCLTCTATEGHASGVQPHRGCERHRWPGSPAGEWAVSGIQPAVSARGSSAAPAVHAQDSVASAERRDSGGMCVQ